MILHHLPHAIVELTPYCNLHCAHCYNWWEKDSYAVTSSFRNASRLLDFLINHTTVQDIIFTGGEPTFADRFIELVVHALVHEKRVTLITNGNGPEKTYRQLADLKLCRMQFSIHSANPRIHDQMTGIKGSWDRAVFHLQQMQQCGLSVVPVMVITALNWEGAGDTLQFYHSLNLNRVLVNRYNLGGLMPSNCPKISATAEQLRSAFRQMDTVADRLQMSISSGVCTPYCLLNPKDYLHIGFGSCSDQVYRRPITFDLEGNLRLCNHSPRIAGNIYQQSLSEIFSSEYVLEWSACKIPFCRNCSVLNVCRGGCRAASEQLGFTLTHEDPIIKELGVSGKFIL